MPMNRKELYRESRFSFSLSYLFFSRNIYLLMWVCEIFLSFSSKNLAWFCFEQVVTLPIFEIFKRTENVAGRTDETRRIRFPGTKSKQKKLMNLIILSLVSTNSKASLFLVFIIRSYFTIVSEVVGTGYYHWVVGSKKLLTVSINKREFFMQRKRRNQ